MSSLDIDFTKSNGLVPVVVQDSATYQVLMLGYMNKEAYEKTCSDKLVTFYSRSKQRLWQKGEESGNTLGVKEIFLDCDRDTLLVYAEPKGPTCHKGSVSCFKDDLLNDFRFLGALERVVNKKIREDDNEDSYTAKLSRDGIKRIAQKVGEEGVELSLAAVSGDRAECITEASDLLYHLLVLLQKRSISLEEIGECLRSRSSC